MERDKKVKTVRYSIKTVDGGRYDCVRRADQPLGTENKEWLLVYDGKQSRKFWKNNIVCITRKEEE